MSSPKIKDIQILRLQQERTALEFATQLFESALRSKLIEGAEKGRTGWDDPEWPLAEIQDGLLKHIDKGDPLDVAAFCMFLWMRNASTNG